MASRLNASMGPRLLIVEGVDHGSRHTTVLVSSFNGATTVDRGRPDGRTRIRLQLTSFNGATIC